MKNVNPIKRMFVVGKTDANMSDTDIANFLGKSREAVCRQINRDPNGWTLGALKEYANVLDIETDDICDAVREYLSCC